MYHSRLKIFFCVIILGIILSFAVYTISPKFKKDKNKTEKLALVDLSTLDSDRDGLSDKKEQELGTNQYSSDTDSDGYSDLEETKANHNPLKIESKDLLDEDGDGLTAEDEKKYGTNPKNPDSDNDGYTDGQEIVSGHNPAIADISFLKSVVPNDEKSASAVSAMEGVLNANSSGDLAANLSTLSGGSASSQETLDFSSIGPEVKKEDIKVKLGNPTQEDAQLYVNSLGVIGFKSLPFSMTSEEETQNFLSGLDPNDLGAVKKLTKNLDDGYSLLKILEVPNDEEIIVWHKDLLSLLLKIKDLTNSWEQSNSDYSVVMDIFKKTQSLQNYAFSDLQPRLKKIAEKYKINLPDTTEFYSKISR